MNCTVENCQNEFLAKGFCRKHYMKNRKYGTPFGGKPGWGKGSVTKEGYRVIGSTLEHRIIMEKELGRKLKQNEDVHHINGDRLDNRVENLMVLSHRDHLLRFSGRRKHVGCKIEGCNGKHKGLGLCGKHYQYLRTKRVMQKCVFCGEPCKLTSVMCRPCSSKTLAKRRWGIIDLKLILEEKEYLKLRKKYKLKEPTV
jgi:hypothetical protein